MDGMCVVAAHRHGHAAYSASKCASTHQTATMQGLDTGTFFDTKFTQPLGFSWREEVPFDAINEGRAAQRKIV